MERTDLFDVIHFIAFIVVAIKAGYWLYDFSPPSFQPSRMLSCLGFTCWLMTPSAAAYGKDIIKYLSLTVYLRFFF